MTHSRTLVLLLGAAAVLIIGGCSKNVELTFHNQGFDPRQVVIPGESIGTVQPGRSVKYKFKFEKDELPASIRIEFAETDLNLTIDEDSRNKWFVYYDDIDGVTGPVDDKTEIRRAGKHEYQEIIDQYEVVD